MIFWTKTTQIKLQICFGGCCLHRCAHQQPLQEDPPWFEFLVIFLLIFFAPRWRRSRRASSVKQKKSNKRSKEEVGLMRDRSCSLVEGFYTKLYTKSTISESSIAFARLKTTVKLGTFVHHARGYNTLPRIFYFVPRDFVLVEKRGKIITKLWKVHH